MGDAYYIYYYLNGWAHPPPRYTYAPTPCIYKQSLYIQWCTPYIQRGAPVYRGLCLCYKLKALQALQFACVDCIVCITSVIVCLCCLCCLRYSLLVLIVLIVLSMLLACYVERRAYRVDILVIYILYVYTDSQLSNLQKKDFFFSFDFCSQKSGRTYYIYFLYIAQ